MFGNIVCTNGCQFIKIMSLYEKIGYNINILQQTACFVVNQIKVGNFAYLIYYTPAGPASSSVMVLVTFPYVFCWVIVFIQSPCLSLSICTWR